jgi:hypothetical protein
MSPPFLTSALDGGEWSAPCPSRFTFEKSPQYPLHRRLGGLKNRYRHCEEHKYLTSTWIRIPAVQPLARRYTNCISLGTYVYILTAELSEIYSFRSSPPTKCFSDQFAPLVSLGE